jgi:hypothetical protein
MTLRVAGGKVIAGDAEDRMPDRSSWVLKPMCIRQSQHLNNRLKQDHRVPSDVFGQ